MNDGNQLLTEKKALLLDMNGTFMFGEDRFGPSEDFSIYYSTLGGTLTRSRLNSIVREIYEYLNQRYMDERYRHNFPSVKQALAAVTHGMKENNEVQKIIDTFAYHEIGRIPPIYANALRFLSQRFVLGAVIDIWSPKALWLDAFENSGISDFFSAMSFSSDHGMVKPSPKPFELVLGQLNVTNVEAIVVGDSPRRDLGGARAAGIDCILVGDAEQHGALGSFSSLLKLSEEMTS